MLLPLPIANLGKCYCLFKLPKEIGFNDIIDWPLTFSIVIWPKIEPGLLRSMLLLNIEWNYPKYVTNTFCVFANFKVSSSYRSFGVISPRVDIVVPRIWPYFPVIIVATMCVYATEDCIAGNKIVIFTVTIFFSWPLDIGTKGYIVGDKINWTE